MEKQKNIPTLRFPEFKQTWEKKKLGDLLEFKNGINAGKEQYGRGVKFINVLDILNNEFITHDKIIGSVDVDEDTAKKYTVSYGDILFQRSSETREEVGSASVYLDKEKSSTFGGFVIRGKKIGEYDPAFLNMLLKTDLARDEITSKSGGSTRYNVGQETLSSVNLLFPNLIEQKKISTFINLFDEKLETLKRRKSLLELYKKGVMLKIFSQEIRFKNGHGKTYPLWEQKKLGTIFYAEKGSNLSKDKVVKNGSHECILYGELYTKYKEVIFNIESRTNEYEGLLSKKGDLLIPSSTTTSGVDLANVTALNKEGVLLGGDITVLRSSMNISNVFYAYYLSNYKKQEIANLAQGSTIVHLYYSHLKSMDIDLPCFDEQIKIASFLSSIDEKLNCYIIEIDELKLFRRGLLQKMFC
jgi:type I restriction enzyme S subunit